MPPLTSAFTAALLFCNEVGYDAQAVMAVRQSGAMTQSEILALIHGNPDATDDQKVLRTYLARDAYTYPLYRSDNAKNQAIARFADEQVNQCLAEVL